MIYFVQAVGGGPVKIGFTSNLDRRRKQLEIHYDRPLVVLSTMDGGREEEAEIHARFAHLRFGTTEQFRPASDLMEFINRPLLMAANPESVEMMGWHHRTLNIWIRGHGKRGRPRREGGDPRQVRLSVRVRPEYRDWLATLAAAAGDKDVTAMIERLLIEEGQLIGARPAPPR